MLPADIPSPCYVLSERSLVSNLTKIKDVADRAGVEFILAFKGFAMWSAFPLVKQYVSGATASSLHEAMLCRDFMKAKAHTYCVAYHPEEMEQIINVSSHITFNSLSQLSQYYSEVKAANVSIGLRVNPEQSDVETDLYNPASPHSRLGVTADELSEELPFEIDGLHFHVLCESSAEALEKVLESLEHKFEALLKKVSWVNMGGGHLLTRDGYDSDRLVSLLTAFKQRHNVKVILEPGSAFAWETGDLHTTVLDIVQRKGVKTAIIDASFTCHMPDCLEMPYRPSLEEGYKDASKYPNQYRLGGVSCLAGDYLEEYSFPKALNIGDRIVFKDMMHYTMVKTTTFNGVKHPSIAKLNLNGEFELVRQFGYEDYKGRLS